MTRPDTSLRFRRLRTRTAPPHDLLSGIWILDLTSSIAGPYGVQLLADLGASVVRIEVPVTGEDARAWGPPFVHGESLWFAAVNRRKRGTTFDITSATGRERLHRMLAHCDVILLNLVGRVRRKLQFDGPGLRAINPRQIHLSPTGFGFGSDGCDLPCYDLIAEGYSVLMDLTAEEHSAPQKVGTSAADMLGGDAALAVLAWLLHRDRTGQGGDIGVSMVEGMLRFMAPRLLPYLGSDELSRRSGGPDGVVAIFQVFETMDEPITLGLKNDAISTRFWKAVRDADFGICPVFQSNADRRRHRAVIVGRIAAILRAGPRPHWLQAFAEACVPADSVHRLKELTADTEFPMSGFLYQTKDRDGGLPQVGLGIRFDGRTDGTESPTLGEHSPSILQEWLGCNVTQVDELRARGVVQAEFRMQPFCQSSLLNGAMVLATSALPERVRGPRPHSFPSPSTGGVDGGASHDRFMH